ncbi:hypothetical protein [Asaia astilbis]|uniref:hypothetical protein n=1 Tax=Asaia astilbis TaxID=610244 RepID=UPI0012EBAE6E|nr:hypothetical protein [Asaia astilbis]
MSSGMGQSPPTPSVQGLVAKTYAGDLESAFGAHPAPGQREGSRKRWRRIYSGAWET